MLIVPIIVIAGCGHSLFTVVIPTSFQVTIWKCRPNGEREQGSLSPVLPCSAEALLSNQQERSALDSDVPVFAVSESMPLG